jgi:hypothetical protein
MPRSRTRYLDDDIDVCREEADKDSKLELGEDQLPANPYTRTILKQEIHPPEGSGLIRFSVCELRACIYSNFLMNLLRFQSLFVGLRESQIRKTV